MDPSQSGLLAALVIYLSVHLTLSLIYFENWFYLRKARKKHHEFIQGLISEDPEVIETSNKASVWLGANTAEIKRRILKLGLKDGVHPYVEPVGYGNVMRASVSVLDNILVNNSGLQPKVKSQLSDACGYSAVVARRHLNPVYWIETLVFLPRAIAKSFGVESGKFVPLIRLAEFAYYIVGIYWIFNQTGLISLLTK